MKRWRAPLHKAPDQRAAALSCGFFFALAAVDGMAFGVQKSRETWQSARADCSAQGESSRSWFPSRLPIRRPYFRTSRVFIAEEFLRLGIFDSSEPIDGPRLET